MYNEQKEEVYEGSLMERLKAFLLKKEQQTLIGIPASQTEIINAQRQLHIQFHTDYVEFITTFGGCLCWNSGPCFF